MGELDPALAQNLLDPGQGLIMQPVGVQKTFEFLRCKEFLERKGALFIGQKIIIITGFLIQKQDLGQFHGKYLKLTLLSIWL